MKYTVEIISIRSVDEIKGYWQSEDYRALLKLLDFADADEISDIDLREMLFLAVSDYEPEDAAAIFLNYKLSDHLSEGQIDQLSHEMQQDKISEEYADISLHYYLYNVNQLLFKAYNGKFPNIKASIIDFKIVPIKEGKEEIINKEIVLKAFGNGFSESSLLKRLFPKQLNGEAEFLEAESIIWDLISVGEQQFQAITSDYWIDKSDFKILEFEANVKTFIPEEDE